MATRLMPKQHHKADTLCDPDKSVAFLIRRCGAVMALVAEREFAARSLSFMQWFILVRLNRNESMSPTQLSEDIGHDMGGLTRIVDVLNRNGLVHRRRSTQNRRVVEISISPEGRREAEQGRALLVDLLNEIFEPFSTGEIDVLVELLQRLLLRLEIASRSSHAAKSVVQSLPRGQNSVAKPKAGRRPGSSAK